MLAVHTQISWDAEPYSQRTGGFYSSQADDTPESIERQPQWIKMEVRLLLIEMQTCTNTDHLQIWFHNYMPIPVVTIMLPWNKLNNPRPV